jgi:PadR family transcriptional regulator PadR
MAESKAETGHKRIEEHSKIFRDLLLGFIKVHVLFHASQEEVFGLGISSELERHGYTISPGTLYPLLHNLEAAKMLQRKNKIVDGKLRKYYVITPLGEETLEEARDKMVELVEEIFSPGDKRRERARAAVSGRKQQAS